VRPYVAGDDVRDIEWNVTARMGEPHVRLRVAERVLTVWVILDVSASMAFGTADGRKSDVAEGVALAVGHIATQRGNRIGLVAFGNEGLHVVPSAQGRTGMMGLLAALRRLEPVEKLGPTSLDAVFRRAFSMLRSRSAVFVVSDWRSERDWHRSLLRLSSRHEVIAVEIRDPREERLVDVGELWLVDPETGDLMSIDTSKRSLRRRFEDAASQERTAVAHDLRRARADHVVLSTEGDWLRTFAQFLDRRGARR
jgi:uncharacterized protein (DUF58 family)